MVDTIKIPCPTDGCDGDVHAARALSQDGTDWNIVRLDEVPVVLCSRSCRTPDVLVGPVESAVRAG
jgi:hypothetical protein